MIGPSVAPPAQYACADGEATQLPTPYRPGIGRADVVEHLPVRIDLRAPLRVERAAGHERRVVGAAVADRPHRRVGAPRFLLDVSVEHQRDRPLAAAEVRRPCRSSRSSLNRAIDASRLARKSSARRQPTGDGGVLREPGGDVRRQLGQGFALDDMAVVAARRDDQPPVLVARRVSWLRWSQIWTSTRFGYSALSPSHVKKTWASSL